MKLLTWPDERLTKRCKFVNAKDLKGVRKNALIMLLIMAANDGAAIAASQVGILQRFFCVRPGLLKHNVIVNPTWVPSEHSELVEVEEGCLSFPDLTLKIKRHSEIVVEYQDDFGILHTDVLKDFAAQVFQHETDHLEGRVFIDNQLTKEI